MPTPSSPRARRSPGSTDGHVKILAQAIETAAGTFLAGTFNGASARLIGMTWGPEDLSAELGAEANRDKDGRLTEPYQLARSLCLFGAAAAQTAAIETIYADFRNLDGLRRDTEEARRDGFVGTARDPSGAGRGHQRGVHADARKRWRRRARSSRRLPQRRAPARSPSTA